MFDYFRAGENEQYLFVQLPLLLIKDKFFKDLSSDSKILYSLLLNRTSLSSKNGWLDDNGYIFIIYTIENIMEDLNCWEKRAIKAMDELKKIGLVRSIRQGLGKPNILYVMNFASTLKNSDQSISEAVNPVNTQNCQNDNSGIVKTTILELSNGQFKSCQNDNSGVVETTILDLSKGQCSYIDLSKIDLNNNDDSQSQSQSQSQAENKFKTDMTPTHDNDFKNKFKTDMTPTHDNDFKNNAEKIVSKKIEPPALTPIREYQQTGVVQINQDDYIAYERMIKENIDHNYLITRYDHDFINDLIHIMIDVILTKIPDTVKIGKEIKSRDVVRSIYTKLTFEHIEHVVGQYEAQHHRIKHKTAYLRTMLYTSYHEINAHYTNAVRADGIIH